jgi:hypothetical protein
MTHTATLHFDPQLDITDAEIVARWFLRNGGGENWRTRLMADLPLVYARVYPGVDRDAILERVAAGLDAVRQEQAEAFAALADKHVAATGAEA